jgi:RimJ/RimL family protein N-acetyltransferase
MEMNLMPVPTVTTLRLILRPFTENDVDALYHILNTGDVFRYFPNPTPPPRARVQRLIAGQLAHWRERHLGWWAIEPRERQELMGWAGLQFLPETNEVEVGYLLGKAYWGQGFATEAAQASLQFGFETLGLDTIVAVVHPDNRASIHVIEKLGMALTELASYFGMDVLRYQMERPAFKCNARQKVYQMV